MLITVASIRGEFSLKINVVWENDGAICSGSAVQTLLWHMCSSLSWLLLLGTSSRLQALVSVWEHRASLPEIAQGIPAPRSSHSLPSHPHLTSLSSLTA